MFGARSSTRPRKIDLVHIIALIGSKIDEFDPRNIANIFWSFAKLNLRPERALLDALCDKGKRSAGSFKPQEVANTLWALATLGESLSPSLLAALSSVVERSAGSFNPQEVANTLWALATLGESRSPSLLAALSSAAERLAGSFKPQNVANTLWALATLGLTPSASVLEALSSAAERLAGSFNPQNVANTLWALATLGISPSPSLLEALSSAAERLAGFFNPQNVANTLWALATLGESLSPSLLAALSSAAERLAGFSNPQDVANTLWAFAVLHTEPPSILASRAFALEAAFEDKNLQQISYAYLVGHALGWSWQLPNELVQRVQSVQRRSAQQLTVSRLQQRVYEALQGMGQQPQLEALTDDGLFSIDIALPASTQESQPKTAVEVDGPSHFTSSGGKTGSTQLRDFLLEQRGWRVVSLPYFAIDSASTDAELNEYLAGTLFQCRFPSLELCLAAAVTPGPASPVLEPRAARRFRCDARGASKGGRG